MAIKYSRPKVRAFTATALRFLNRIKAEKACKLPDCVETRRIAMVSTQYASDSLEPSPRREPVPQRVGECPCGRRIEIGDRYSLSLTGPTTIKRPCGDCDRINEIVLTVDVAVKPAGWVAHTCLCRAPIYLRSDYAGHNFPEYRGQEIFRPGERDKTYRNRTVKTPCRMCPCKYVIEIRF